MVDWAWGSVARSIGVSRYYLFFGYPNRLQPRRPHRFWRKIRQKTRFRARMCLWGLLLIFYPFRVSDLPKTSSFGSWMGIFKPNARNIETYYGNCCISTTKFCSTIRTINLNTLRGWSMIYAQNKSMMVCWCTLASRPYGPDKNRNFKIQHGGRPPFWKRKIAKCIGQ